MNKRNENLDKLLNGFYDKDQAEDFKANLNFTEKILDVTPCPEPSQELLNDIKNNLKKNNEYKFTLYSTIKVAAAILIIAAITLLFTANQNNTEYESVLTASIWQSNNLALDDSDLFEIENSLNDISDQLLTMEDDNGYELANSLTELEIDFVDL